MFLWPRIPESHRPRARWSSPSCSSGRARVAVVPGLGYGEYGDDYVRSPWWRTNSASTRPRGGCDASCKPKEDRHAQGAVRGGCSGWVTGRRGGPPALRRKTDIPAAWGRNSSSTGRRTQTPPGRPPTAYPGRTSPRVAAVLDEPRRRPGDRVIGGLSPAGSSCPGHRKRKQVVTATRPAWPHAREIFAAARKAGWGGLRGRGGRRIPPHPSLREGLSATHHLGPGLLNGTCNYILTRMTEEGRPTARYWPPPSRGHRPSPIPPPT